MNSKSLMLNVANFLSNSEELKAQRNIASDGIAQVKRRTKNEPRLAVPSCHGRREPG